MAPLTALATAGDAPLQAVQFWRYLTSTVVLGLLAARGPRAADRKAPVGAAPVGAAPVGAAPAPWRSPAITLLGGGAQFAVASLSLSALRFLPAATIGFLFYTFPAWVTLGSAMRGVEPLTARRALALALALGGIAGMVGTPGAAPMAPLGVLLALAAALVYALYLPLMGARQRGLPPLGVAFAVSLGGTLWFLVWCAGSGALLPVPGTHELLLSASMGVLGAGAFYGLLAGLAALGAVRTAITSTIEPLWTALLGVLVLAQPLGVGTLLGGAGVLAAVILLSLPER
jgi:drug/metabolite transporter (DMT)-like permease